MSILRLGATARCGAVRSRGHEGGQGRSWVSFFQWRKGRELIVGDKCLGMLEAVGELCPDVKYQRCTLHFYRNVFSVVPRSKGELVAKLLRAIHAQESKAAALAKTKEAVTARREIKLKEATVDDASLAG